MVLNTILPETDEAYERKKEEIEANVHLTAAAPELLEALMDMIDTFDPEKQALYSFAKNKIDKAKNAIKKALEG